jgi:hypothetical protein
LSERQAPVLAFCKGDGLTQVLLLDEVAEGDRKRIHVAANLWRGAVTLESRVLWGAGVKVHAVREAVEFAADLPPAQVSTVNLFNVPEVFEGQKKCPRGNTCMAAALPI